MELVAGLGWCKARGCFADEGVNIVVDMLLAGPAGRKLVDCGDLSRSMRFEDGREIGSWDWCWWCAMVPSETGDRGEGALFCWLWSFLRRRLVG